MSETDGTPRPTLTRCTAKDIVGALKARTIGLEADYVAAWRVESLEAEIVALRAQRDMLKREVALTHERLDELDRPEPLCDWLPALVDECYRKNMLIKERDRLRVEGETLRTALAPFAALVHEDGIDAPYPEEKWKPMLIAAQAALRA